MGQLTLGLRSLVIKLAVFVVMAALLAWALGGTLWPRPEVVDFAPITFQGREWFPQLTVSRRRPEPVEWRLLVRNGEGRADPADPGVWRDMAPPIVVGEALYYAGLTGGIKLNAWQLIRIDGSGQRSAYAMPDRLAVEQQLSRVAAGLSVQDESEIRRERRTVIQPSPEIDSSAP
jgi:hypothetical protein